MRINSLIIFALLLTSLSVISQDFKAKKPNYKKIEKKIKKNRSEMHYPKLMDKYLVSDTNMTLEEKRYLYYGYTFHPAYSPYGSSKFLTKVRLIANKDTFDTVDYMKIIEFTDSALLENPFDLRALNYQLQVYNKLEMYREFNAQLFKMDAVFDAIISTGNGLTMKTPLYVISTTHEYDLLNVLGYEFGGEQSLIDQCDYLKISENADNIEGLYFDVSPCLKSLNDMFK